MDGILWHGPLKLASSKSLGWLEPLAPSTVAQPWEVVFDVAPGRVVCDAQLRPLPMVAWISASTPWEPPSDTIHLS